MTDTSQAESSLDGLVIDKSRRYKVTMSCLQCGHYLSRELMMRDLKTRKQKPGHVTKEGFKIGDGNCPYWLRVLGRQLAVPISEEMSDDYWDSRRELYISWHERNPKIDLPEDEIDALIDIERVNLDVIRNSDQSVGRFRVLDGHVSELAFWLHDIVVCPRTFRNLRYLRELHINGTCELNGSYFDWIFSLHDLEVLGLGGVKFSTLPEAVGDLRSLIYLGLSQNDLVSLPDSIGQLTALKKLKVMRNQLKTLPESIGELKSLGLLNLRDNKLKTLPESFGGLSALFEASLENNRLESLPESIGNLSNLLGLSLNNNELTSLPDSIGNLEKLQGIGLSGNKLRDLPSSIGNLRHLSSFFADRNQLTILPDSFVRLRRLNWLSLAGNKLIALPESFGNLRGLNTLDLHENKLTSLPETIVDLNVSELKLTGNPLIDVPAKVELWIRKLEEQALEDPKHIKIEL